jgi:hypothetical protein
MTSGESKEEGPLERGLTGVLSVLLLVALGLACAFPFTLTLGADEAWILSGVQGLVERGEYASELGIGATTTGGLQTIVLMALYALGDGSLWLLRLFPLVCFVLLLHEVTRWSRLSGGSSRAGLLACSAVIALPGTLTLAGTAYGVIPATLLVLFGLRLWDAAADRGFVPATAAALVLGLAAATRLQCVLVFPAVALVSAGSIAELLRFLRTRALSLALGTLFFLAAYFLLQAVTPDPGAAANFGTNSTLASSLASSLDLPFMLKKWISAARFLPLPLLGGASLVAVLLRPGSADGARREVALVAFGWLVWLLWIAIAPRDHLRYLWPGLAAFGVVLGLGLGALYDRSQRRDLRLAALILGIFCALSGTVEGSRQLWVGDLDMLTWEWREVVGLQPALRGTPLPDGENQRRMAERLQMLPADQRIGGLGSAADLAFLSRRNVESIHLNRLERKSLPRWIVVTPHIGHRVHLSEKARRWLSREAILEVRFGDYALYRVRRHFPRAPRELRLLPGPPPGVQRSGAGRKV